MPTWVRSRREEEGERGRRREKTGSGGRGEKRREGNGLHCPLTVILYHLYCCCCLLLPPFPCLPSSPFFPPSAERAKQQSWDEKARLSRLYEEERTRNLENETKIRSVMQTIKEDNKELLKRMRALMTERTRLTKRFKTLKETHLSSRDRLAALMGEYQRLEADGGEQGPHKQELEELLQQISVQHKTVEEESAELKEVKEQIKTNEKEQVEARAEAAAQRMLLEEDAELRKAIAEEERSKLEKEAEDKMLAEIEKEKNKLREEAEKERQALLSRYSGAEMAGDKAQELELRLIQAEAERRLLKLELERQRAQHEADLNRLRQSHSRALHDAKVQELRMFREMVAAFEEEKAGYDGRTAEQARALEAASEDIRFLLSRVAELERQLVIAAAWEPASAASAAGGVSGGLRSGGLF